MKVKPDHEAAAAVIEHLVANPPPPRTKPIDRDDFGSSMNILANVDAFRRKLAAERGYTYEQWLEMEANVNHPTEIVPIVPTEKVLARRRMNGAGVPARFIRDVCDKDPLDCDPLRSVREFLNGRDSFRVLQGGKGTRKTGSACWALGQLDGGAFIEAADVIQVSIEDKARWDAILRSPLVVFDDLGTEKRDDKAAFTSAFSKLINTVYSQSRRMIITCNVTPVVFRQVYGEREYDRLKEAGKWSVIGGQSVRQYQEREPGEEG